MNGANALIRTLIGCGVDTCFMNPGTSEMHFVAALDDVPELHSVLALFEGVATGAADGYARMAGRPAATLLHLGPGLGNGLANLHNARKGFVPIVNIVGDHATYHKQYDAQLESDIETVARNVSSWIRTSTATATLAQDAVDAVVAASGPPGEVATLILPADVSWTDGAEPAKAPSRSAPGSVDEAQVAAVARVLQSGEKATLFIGGRACRAGATLDASRIANHTGAGLLSETFPARIERGAGRVAVKRLAYLAEFAAMELDGLSHLILVDAKSPVSFFAYPGKASDLVPEGCQVHVLSAPDGDPAAALAALAEAVGAPADAATIYEAQVPELPTGPLTADGVCQALAALMPEGAIVSDEGNTSGLYAAAYTRGAPPHDWLTLTGGAIGQGLPVAVGAAVAAPGRQVIALQADGAAMYTLQSWWTMAREQLDVVTIVMNNSSYAVLNMELQRVGATAGGPRAKAMLDLHQPNIDFVALATGMGVPATRATTAEDFVEQLSHALATKGPWVIDAVIPSVI